MTSASDRRNPTVPIGSVIVHSLKSGGPRSASALAQCLRVRKADVLRACRALAAAGQIHRLGKRWALRPPVRCAGLNQAGRRCARVASYGSSAFCIHHELDAGVPPPEPAPRAPERSIADHPASTNARGLVASPVSPEEPAPTRPPDAAPELFVGGRRVTEAEVIDALSMLGDEEVQAYREGRLLKTKAYRIAYDRLRTLAEWGR
jgi:hypothetical protein